ncbi:MAG: hypothetical protein R3279_00530 [Putridiphycobacter sp.]|nr:hypothetical protein [Putridiphycobacter sp.]
MGKTIIRIFWLVVGLTGIAYGGYTLYSKQFFPISHQAFVQEKGISIYIPDVDNFLKKDNSIALLETYGQGEWTWFFDLSKAYHFENVSVQLSGYEAQQTLSIEGDVDLFFEAELKSSYDETNHTMTLRDVKYFFWKKGRFLVLSKDPVQVNPVKYQVAENLGNADFFVKGTDGIVEAIKLTKNVKYSAYVATEALLRGKPVSALEMLSVCPSKADVVKFYGSTRYNDDAATLQYIDTSDYNSWVTNSVLYIKKDSFELLAGVQNDGQLLKNLLLEATAENSSDTIVRNSIYFNNTEIIPFDAHWNWQLLCADMQSDLHYFAAYNDYVFLANSLQAMYWLLKNIQLGKTFDAFELSKKIPSLTNNLVIERTENDLAISTRAWISPYKSINMAALSGQIDKSISDVMVGEFDYGTTNKMMLCVKEDTSEMIVLVSDEFVEGKSFDGRTIWRFEAQQPVSLNPIVIKQKNKKPTLLATVVGQQLKVTDLAGQFIKQSSISLQTEIKYFDIIQSENDTMIVLQSENQITSYNLRGQSMPLMLQFISPIRTVKTQLIANKPMLTVITANDSVFVYDVMQNEQLGASKITPNKGKVLQTVVSDQLLPSQLKLIVYNQNMLAITDLKTGLIDSLKLNTKMKADKAHWIDFKGKPFLVLENFDRITVFNTLGLSELEIAKPESNAQFLPNAFPKKGIFAFVNAEANKCYFTDEYGNLLLKNAIAYEGSVFLSEAYIASKANNRIHIYKIN